MARKSIHLERVGMLMPRERIWQAVRKLGTFTVSELQDATHPVVNLETCEDYLQSLAKSGHLTLHKAPRAPGAKYIEATYALAKDAFEAPRVTVAGGAVSQGVVTLAMWRAMKALREFTHADIQVAASVGTCQVTPHTAKSYVNALARAGYFRVVQAAKPNTPARYRLIRDTGAHPPAITRRKAIFDRNVGEFTWQQPEQEACDDLN